MPVTHSPHLVSQGQTFGRFTVIGFSHNDKRHRRHYLVRCACGTVKTVQGTLLRSGNTQSCGCLATEARKAKALPRQRGVVNQIILQYKRHAKGRDLKFCLTPDQVDEIVRQPCHYCGLIGSNNKKTKHCKEGFKHNGIDRVDSLMGYTPGNVVACCWQCNMSKRDMSKENFLAWAARIANHQKAMAAQWG